MFAMIAPAVKRPPSRKRWKQIILSVIGNKRSAASAVRFMIMRPIQIANTIAIMYTTYFAVKSILINANASGVL